MAELDRYTFSQITDFVANDPCMTMDEFYRAVAFACDHDWRIIACPYCFHPYLKEELKKRGKENKIGFIGGAGFPSGNWPTEIKKESIRLCKERGAVEFDLTCNLSWIKSGMYEEIKTEIREVREIIGDKVLKLICHVPALTEQEILDLCRICEETGIDYFKTGTGREGSYTTVEQIAFIRQHLDEKVKIKASGGVKDLEKVLAMMDAGAVRLGMNYKNAIAIYNQLEN